MTSADFAFIAAFLKERSGLIITPDKMYLLETRLTSILRDNGLKDLPALVEMLRQPGRSAMKDKVVDAMTTNETSFFRDSHPFDTLRKSILPGLIEKRAASRTLRIWSAACSTGQEPYSLAMILKDHFPILGGWKVEIVATDISPSVLERARDGLYSTFEVQRGMPIQMLIRHFDQVDQHWRIKPELRQNISFRPANLLDDLSILGSFDIVLCRNVLIYFDQPTKTRILHAIARRLTPDGALLLGGAESVFGLCDAFANTAGLKGVYGHANKQTKLPAAAWTAPPLPVAS
jgi:chemotaxis protein methyltransferase CheR